MPSIEIVYTDSVRHIPHQFRYISTKIFQLCCVLVNFQDPLLQEVAQKITEKQIENYMYFVHATSNYNEPDTGVYFMNLICFEKA